MVSKLLAKIGDYEVTKDRATGMPVCNCMAGRYGTVCKHIKAVDPTAKNVWEE